MRGFRASWLHMRECHPRKKGTGTDVREQLSDEDSSETKRSEAARSDDSFVNGIKRECEEEVIIEGGEVQHQEGKDDLKQEGAEKGEVKEEPDFFCFQCIVCDAAYWDRDHLKTHLWRHVNAVVPTPQHYTRVYTKSWTETTFWVCPRCDKKLPGLATLLVHNRSVHGMETGLECPVCRKNDFSKKFQLRTHLYTHNENKLPCEVGYFILGSLGNLTIYSQYLFVYSTAVSCSATTRKCSAT